MHNRENKDDSKLIYQLLELFINHPQFFYFSSCVLVIFSETIPYISNT